MKTFRQLIIWTIVLFVLLTLLTMKREAAHCGVNEYGFPWMFYDYFEGKCDNCYNNFGYKPINLIKDIGVIATINMFVILIIKRLREELN